MCLAWRLLVKQWGRLGSAIQSISLVFAVQLTFACAADTLAPNAVLRSPLSASSPLPSPLDSPNVAISDPPMAPASLSLELPSTRASHRRMLGPLAQVVLDPARPCPGETLRVFIYGFERPPDEISLRLYGGYGTRFAPCGLPESSDPLMVLKGMRAVRQTDGVFVAKVALGPGNVEASVRGSLCFKRSLDYHLYIDGLSVGFTTCD